MNTPSLLFLFLLAGVAVQAAEPPPTRAVAPNDGRIAYMGRVELTGQRAQMGFPGITIRFVYRGPAPTLKLTADSPNCFFNLACNGWDPVVIRLKPGDNEIALPTGVAPAGGWLVELVRRTESWMGTASFDGLVLPAGCELLAPPPWPRRKMMFIGDSIVCGEYLERFPPESDPTPRSTNAARSYPMLLGRWLDAQVHLVSYGGRGITRDWSGKTDVNTVPVFFPRTLPDQPGSVWDPSRYTPDVIVIDVGTDFDSGTPAEPKFTEAYAAFVAQVRSTYPAAIILLSESGFQSDGSNGRPRTDRDHLLRTMRAVVEGRHRLGDERISIVRVGYYPGTPADGHLVAFQHEQLALSLLGQIREAAGW